LKNSSPASLPARRARTVLGTKHRNLVVHERGQRPLSCLLRYEDLLADTARELAQGGHIFCNFPQARSRLRKPSNEVRPIACASSKRSKPDRNTLMKGSRKDLSFVRAAGAGGWRSDLPAPQAARIEAAWGHLMQHLGYELSSQSPAEVREYGSLRDLSGVPR